MNSHLHRRFSHQRPTTDARWVKTSVLLLSQSAAFQVQGYAKGMRREMVISGVFMMKRLRNDLTQKGRSGNGDSLHGAQWLKDRERKGKEEGRGEEGGEGGGGEGGGGRYKVQVQTQQLTYYVTLDERLPLWGCGRLSSKMHCIGEVYGPSCFPSDAINVVHEDV